MRRTSFVGALAVIALGGILAFGIQKSPRDLDLHLTGLIILIAGVADLVLRFLIANNPLFSPDTADVAAVVEPVGDPVLDAFGNPVMTAETAARPPLMAPGLQNTQILPVVVEPPAPAAPTIEEALAQRPESAVHEGPAADQVVRQVGDHSTDEGLVPVSLLTGRPVRRRRRRMR